MSVKLRVAVIMGSDSDLPTMQPVFDMLKKFGVDYEGHVMSAHRTPVQSARFATGARDSGIGVIIAAAGKAAHLAGVIAAHTTLPVIGVPVGGGTLGGMDALLATVQMPAGIPVATVAIDGAANAALLAVQILAVADAQLAEKLSIYKAEMTQAVLIKDARLTQALAAAEEK